MSIWLNCTYTNLLPPGIFANFPYFFKVVQVNPGVHMGKNIYN